MSNFAYKAKQGPGKVVNGVIDAENFNDAVKKITRAGLIPIDILEQAKKRTNVPKNVLKKKRNIFNRVKLSDLVIFTRQISDLVEASVPILRSLEIIYKQTADNNFKEIIDDIRLRVKDGSSFSSALSVHTDIFSPLYINMIKAGEVGGQLSKVLLRLADFLEKQQETRNKIKASLAYPILILVVGVITIFVLLTFVIPKISIMFEDFDQKLPLATIILMEFSRLLEKFWIVIVGFVIFLGFYFRIWLNSEGGRRWFDMFKLKIPFLGKFVQVVEIGNFMRTLGTLAESGVPINTALNSSCLVVNNKVIQEELIKASSDVSGGKSFIGALKQSSYFPEMAINMISVSEETGKMEKGLYKAADNFERQADATTKVIVSLLGPIVLILVVSIVGFFVIAMLLPIFKMNLLIQ